MAGTQGEGGEQEQAGQAGDWPGDQATTESQDQGGSPAGGLPGGAEADGSQGQDGGTTVGGGAPGEEDPFARQPSYGSNEDPFAPEGGAAGAGPDGAATGDRRAEIDRRLEDTFGAFDTAVRTAQEQIAKERAQQGTASAAGGFGGPFGSDEGSDSMDTAAGSQRRPGLESVGAGGAEEWDREGGSQGGGTGVGGSTGSGPREIPGDIPDGSDDDIVARQIREAAMAEADPELREALWDEYRKYKKGR